MTAPLCSDTNPNDDGTLATLTAGLAPRLAELDRSDRVVWDDLSEMWVAHVQDILFTVRALRTRAVEIAIAKEAYDTLYPASRCVVADVVDGSFTTVLPEPVRQALMAS